MKNEQKIGFARAHLTSQGMSKENRGKVQADLPLSLEPFAPGGQICIDSPENGRLLFLFKMEETNACDLCQPLCL